MAQYYIEDFKLKVSDWPFQAATFLWHGCLMTHARSAVALAGALACSGCFQFSTVLTLKADGSGTIDQHILFSQAAIAQLQQFAAPGGGQDFEPISEQQARDAATTMGPGVTYVSSSSIDTGEGVGRDIRYAFSDVSQLHLDQGPPPPGGLPLAAQRADASDHVSFKLTRQADGHALLKIAMPQLRAGGDGTSPSPSSPSAAQIAMLKPLLAGARLTMAVEPDGRLIRTSSPYVTGQRVTLADVNIDLLLNDDTLLQRLQSARTPDEAKAILKSVPGLEVNLDPEITIEFEAH
jgi:hypothetical protein